MAKPIIEVHKLFKKYKIGTRQPYYSLRDTMMGTFSKSTSWFRKRQFNKKESAPDEFWALKNVSFNVMPGDIVGIIGRNGAGKSTLLKIISRITPPTLGEVCLRGRVASLLNVGTGFHPELTGRENIFLNGAILGMKRTEIKKKLDEIINFAEIEKFIDTPVKYYSSGMYMRLAFAVASHLEPEILIVDEVLAVGDLMFQQKCLDKMDEVNKKGRTVLLVSHDMDSIQTLARRAVLLENGQTEGLLPVPKAVQKYLYGKENTIFGYFKAPKTNTDKQAYIVEAKLLNEQSKNVSSFLTCEPIYLEIKWVNKAGVPVSPNFMLVNQNGIRVMIASDVPVDWDGEMKKQSGVYLSKVKIPANLLNADSYYIHLSLDCSLPLKKNYDNHADALRFSVRDPMDNRCLARGAFRHIRRDTILWAALDWTWERASDRTVL